MPQNGLEKKRFGGLENSDSTKIKEVCRVLAGISLFPLAFIPYEWDKWVATTHNFYIDLLPPEIPWILCWFFFWLCRPHPKGMLPYVIVAGVICFAPLASTLFIFLCWGVAGLAP